MKNLFDITNEGILDDDFTDTAEEYAGVIASVSWLKEHGVKMGGLEDIVKSKHNVYKHILDDDHYWHFSTESIILTKKDDIPNFVNIKEISSIIFSDYDNDILPEKLKDISVKNLNIKNCKNLKSLDNCPIEVKNLSITDCPKLTKINGCPQKVENIFKFINNGVKLTPNEIKRHCKVDKKNIIY